MCVPCAAASTTVPEVEEVLSHTASSLPQQPSKGGGGGSLGVQGRNVWGAIGLCSALVFGVLWSVGTAIVRLANV
jgi:hypothetical protein